MDFYHAKTDLRVGANAFSNIFFSPDWPPYYAFTMGGETQTWDPIQYSIISRMLTPQYKIVDKETNETLTTLKLMPESYYNASVYQSTTYFNSYYTWRVYHSPVAGLIAIRNDTGWVGYAPNDDDEYWQIRHNGMGHYWYSWAMSTGTAIPKGAATIEYSIVPYWPRWELEGRTSGAIPKAGIYDPKDGVEGNFKFGEYDAETDTWSLGNNYSRNLTMGQTVTWQ